MKLLKPMWRCLMSFVIVPATAFTVLCCWISGGREEVEFWAQTVYQSWRKYND